MNALTAVGFRFRGFTPEVLRDKTITLKYEPDNVYDPNAISVLADGVFVGHITKDTQYKAKPYMNHGSYYINLGQTYSASAILWIEYGGGDVSESEEEESEDEEESEESEITIDDVSYDDDTEEKSIVKAVNKLEINKTVE